MKLQTSHVPIKWRLFLFPNVQIFQESSQSGHSDIASLLPRSRFEQLFCGKKKIVCRLSSSALRSNTVKAFTLKAVQSRPSFKALRQSSFCLKFIGMLGHQFPSPAKPAQNLWGIQLEWNLTAIFCAEVPSLTNRRSHIVTLVQHRMQYLWSLRVSTWAVLIRILGIRQSNGITNTLPDFPVEDPCCKKTHATLVYLATSDSFVRACTDRSQVVFLRTSSLENDATKSLHFRSTIPTTRPVGIVLPEPSSLPPTLSAREKQEPKVCARVKFRTGRVSNSIVNVDFGHLCYVSHFGGNFIHRMGRVGLREGTVILLFYLLAKFVTCKRGLQQRKPWWKVCGPGWGEGRVRCSKPLTANMLTGSSLTPNSRLFCLRVKITLLQITGEVVWWGGVLNPDGKHLRVQKQYRYL